MMPNNIPLDPPHDRLLPLNEIDSLLSFEIENISLDTTNHDQLFMLFHRGLRSSVYIGTHLLSHIPRNISGGTEHAAVVMLYRHILDLGDSIATLFRFGSLSAISVLIRGLFESWLALEFVLEGNSLKKDRGLAYWAYYNIKRLEVFTRYDPNTPPGKDFHKILDSCPELSDAKFGRKDHSNERIGLEAILTKDKFKPFYDKYKQLKRSKKKARNWYSLCSDIKDLRSLAKNLGKEAEYAIFYSQLSEVAHASDVISDRLEVSDKGKTYISPLRGGPDQNLKMWANTTSMFLLKSHNLIIESYFPPDYAMRKSYENWYMNYRKFNMWLSGD